jgi:hypothetical protein
MLFRPEQVERLRQYQYWQTLEFYGTCDHDLSWTVIKAFELRLNNHTWSPHDEPSACHRKQLRQELLQFCDALFGTIEDDFIQWVNPVFTPMKHILHRDMLAIHRETHKAIDRFVVFQHE